MRYFFLFYFLIVGSSCSPQVNLSAPIPGQQDETPTSAKPAPGHLVNHSYETQNPLSPEDRKAIIAEHLGADAFVSETEFVLTDVVYSLDDVKVNDALISAFREGNIRGKFDGALLLANKPRLWPGGTLVLEFSNPDYKNTVFAACNTWSRVAKVSCKERSGESTYVRVEASPESCCCFASVGYRRGVLQLPPPSPFIGCALHELGHNFGFDHEQNRPGRNSYVTFHPENAEDKYEYAFSMLSSNTTSTFYDYFSVMHYGPFAFSINGNPTLTATGTYSWLTYFGGSANLTPTDAIGVGNLYGTKPFSVSSFYPNEGPSLLNKLITIQTIRGYYVVAEGGGGPGQFLNANRTAVGSWEKFRVVDAGGGWIALKTANNTYVTAHKDNNGLYADRTALGDWEKFKILRLSNDHYAIASLYGKIFNANYGGGEGIYAGSLSVYINERLLIKTTK